MRYSFAVEREGGLAKWSAAEWYDLGSALHAQRRWGAAAACFARAVESAQDSLDEDKALLHLGWNLHLSGRSGEGRKCINRAITQWLPDPGTAYAMLSQINLTLGFEGFALDSARRGVERAPDNSAAHMSLTFALGVSGLWAECWREYEWRFRYRADVYGFRSVPLWRGEAVDCLWLECEMGLGDTLFGLRWLPAAVERAGGAIELHVQPELRLYVEEHFGHLVSVKPIPRLPPDARAWCPLLSLPVALDMAEPVPAGIPRVLLSSRKELKVGICWSGSPAHEQAHHRDCPLPYWIRLAENPALELHSLQVGGTGQLADLGLLQLVQDRAPEITNFSDTAEILSGLDLLITVDTAVAHLAGTMGVQTWLLVNSRGLDFRWGRDGDTPWYPSVRVWCRRIDEDWGAVLDRVDEELRKCQ